MDCKRGSNAALLRGGHFWWKCEGHAKGPGRHVDNYVVFKLTYDIHVPRSVRLLVGQAPSHYLQTGTRCLNLFTRRHHDSTQRKHATELATSPYRDVIRALIVLLAAEGWQ